MLFHDRRRCRRWGELMFIAQALGEYGVLSALRDGLLSLGDYFGQLWRDWGLTGSLVLVVAVVLWKLLTRVK